MTKNYTRIAVNHDAAKQRRDEQRAAANEAQKNSDLHEKTLKNTTLDKVAIQRGIRAAKDQWWLRNEGGLVYIDSTQYDPATTPSHNIPLLIHSLPITVEVSADEETLEPIHAPFKLPLYWELSKGKYTGDMLKPYFYQLTLSELETRSNYEYRLTPFVFTTSAALENRFKRQKKKRVDFLRDRLQKTLREALQRPKDNPIAYWFSLEMARRGQPHIHGSLLIRPDEEVAIRKAIYELNGGDEMTADEKRDCLRFRLAKREELFVERGRLYADLNWADYNLKERATTRRDYNDLDPIVAVSQYLASHAEDYYRRLRKDFNKQRRIENRTAKPQKRRASKPQKQRNTLFGSW